MPAAPGSEVWRLSGAERFAALRRTRHRTRSGPLRVSWVAGTTDDPPRVGYAVGRQVGSAVVRNRLRRRLRAAVVQLPVRPGDYLVTADPGAASLASCVLKALVSDAFEALPHPDSPAT